jgi:hypothetical protein
MHPHIVVAPQGAEQAVEDHMNISISRATINPTTAPTMQTMTAIPK